MRMDDHNAVFESMLAAYRNADDPDRFLREFLLRLDDATSNAVVATYSGLLNEASWQRSGVVPA